MGLGSCFIFARNADIPNDDDYLVLYEQLIDLIMDDSEKLMVKPKYIAIDTKSYTLLNNYSKGIISYAMSYNDNVFASTYRELEDKGYVMDNGSLEGLLITTKVIKENIHGNRVEIEVMANHFGLDNRGFICKNVFKDKEWDVERIKELIR